MIVGLDSATPPTLAQAQAAKVAGVSMWGGYIATKPNVNLLRPWTQAEFAVVQEVFGVKPLAFCSGWDDPAALRALAAEWGVRLCLDVESGIRDDGFWVDGFLAASGAGLYGLQTVHYHAAPFRVMAAYLGSDPNTTWLEAKGGPPVEPHGWQWQGSHDEFGVTVDRGWYDDWFINEGAAAPQEDDMKGFIVIGPGGEQFAVLPNGCKFGIASQDDLAVLVATQQFVNTARPVSQGQLDQWPTVSAAGAVRVNGTITGSIA